ncbi:hypothetical protein PG993_006019 [Apiospora rasikravindrae]|uniref:Tat pathway signal sequence n=1 Tax=Apiospora rasikravindrae TaxID=990691 RepID=A0ABR1TAE5_9PEZI
MHRGPPPTAGVKPQLSFSNIVHPLPVIEEDSASHDDDETPKVPEKSPRRVSPLAAAASTRARASTPRETAASPTPSSSTANPECIAPKRGGWYRVALMAALAICAVVALTVGLTIGLRQKNNSSPATPNNQEGEQPPVLFPAGSYAFTTALYNITTDCTTNKSTFRCYPFHTYSQSKSKSDAAATYFWTIAPVNSWAFQISAAPNPFVPQFANLSLTQLDANQFSERLMFSFSMHGAAVVPTTALGDINNHDDDRAATCYYNDTRVTGTIWTRRPAEFPANLTTPVSNGGGREGAGGKGKPMTSSTTFDPWPYAVRVVQSTRDPPDCRDADGNRVGGDFGRPLDRAGECSCSYANFDL